MQNLYCLPEIEFRFKRNAICFSPQIVLPGSRLALCCTGPFLSDYLEDVLACSTKCVLWLLDTLHACFFRANDMQQISETLCMNAYKSAAAYGANKFTHPHNQCSRIDGLEQHAAISIMKREVHLVGRGWVERMCELPEVALLHFCTLSLHTGAWSSTT